MTAARETDARTGRPKEALQPEIRNALQLMLHLKSTTVNHLPWLIREGENAAEREIPCLRRPLQLRPGQETAPQ